MGYLFGFEVEEADAALEISKGEVLVEELARLDAFGLLDLEMRRGGTEERVLSSVLLSWSISMMPLALGGWPPRMNLAVPGIQRVRKGVNWRDLERCSMICGALVVSIIN